MLDCLRRRSGLLDHERQAGREGTHKGLPLQAVPTGNMSRKSTETGTARSVARAIMAKPALALRAGQVEAAGTLAVAFFAILALYIPISWIGDLGPVPDAQEYAITARNLAHGGSYTISLLGSHYPPRYPFGFPALIAPAYWLPGPTLANGIYAVVAFGVLAAVLAYRLARLVGGYLAGAVAVIVLLALPQYQLWNHELMSETASAALTVAAALLLYHAAATGDQKRRRAFITSLGLVCGIAILVHVTNVALPIAALIALLADPRRLQPRSEYLGQGGPGGHPQGNAPTGVTIPEVSRRWSTHRRLVADMVALAIGPLAAIACLGIYDKVTFGSFGRTGYAFWVPHWYSSFGATFSPSYALKAPGIGDPSAPHVPNLSYYLGALTGLPSLQSVPVLSGATALLALIGCAVMLRNSQPATRVVAIFTIVFTALTVSIFSLYFFQTVRFLAPVIPLLAISAGVGARAGGTMLLAGLRRRALPQLLFGLAVAALTLAALNTAVRASGQQNYLYQAYVARAQPAGQWNLWTAALYRRTLHQRSIAITDTLLPLLDEAGVTRLARIVPVSRGEYWDKPPLQGHPLYVQQRRQIDEMLRRGVPVYTDTPTLAAARANQSTDHVSWPALEAHRFVPVGAGGAVAIYRLSAAAP
jgi:hypothetical protein